MKRTLITIASFASLILPVTAHGQVLRLPEGFRLTSLAVYNSAKDFDDRCPDPESISRFVKEINDKSIAIWKTEKPPASLNGFIAVAIRPNGTMKLWVDVEGHDRPEISEKLQKEMSTIPVPRPKIGPIAFALNFEVGKPSGDEKPKPPILQIPEAWKKALKGTEKPLKAPDEILPLVWKEEPSDEPAIAVPDGFELQRLNPVGGKMFLPKGWFYTEGHRDRTFMWTLSKENPAAGPYETGVRVQCFFGTKDITGKSPEEFVRSILDDQKMGSKIVSERPVIEQGHFKRIGLEVEKKLSPEGDGKLYRIIYSGFWSDKVDVSVITIAGTPADEWDKYAQTFDTMSYFELIDPKLLGLTKKPEVVEKPEPKP